MFILEVCGDNNDNNIGPQNIIMNCDDTKNVHVGVITKRL